MLKRPGKYLVFLVCLLHLEVLASGPVGEVPNSNDRQYPEIVVEKPLQTGLYGVKWEADYNEICISEPGSKPQPDPISDQEIIKEYRKGFADRGREFALLPAGSIVIGHLSDTGAFIFLKPTSLHSSSYQSILKIRPPPVC